jgi:tetratricopeptide (TPR) repeat protein
MTPIRWGPHQAADLAEPAAVAKLLARAIDARPANAVLRLKLAHFHLDRYDFAAAAKALAAALALDPALPGARIKLARCRNALGRHREALAALEPHESPDLERALALLGLGRTVEAEAELRALLESDAHHLPACRELCKLLRRAGRLDELLATCEGLAGQSVRHSQLLYVWGTALALSGEHERARALLLDEGRITELALPVPAGFADIAAFNAALAEELLGNRYRLDEFPVPDEANRGSSRVHALFAGQRPELIEALMASLQQLADSVAPTAYASFDPWIEARPTAAHLKAWGLIQRDEAYEEWHLHPGGWLSGVYYVRVPEGASAAGAGPGCIEFGPPSALQRARPGYLPLWRHRPREGHLLLAPSHYAHRTIPSGLDEHRISFAFDVVPQRTELARGPAGFDKTDEGDT